MKIKAINPNVVSMKLIVPIDGTIEIDSNGIADVSPKCAVLLVKNTNDWSYVGKESDEVDDTEETETGEEGAKNDATDTEKTERELLEEKLAIAKVDEMRDMCSEAEFPKEEWGKLSKKLLAAYILKKFDEAVAANEPDEADEEDDEEED